MSFTISHCQFADAQVSELRTRGARYTQIAAATGLTLYAVRKLQAAAI